jgi:hypothetical protein
MYLKDKEKVIKKILEYSLKRYDSKKFPKTKYYFALSAVQDSFETRSASLS